METLNNYLNVLGYGSLGPLQPRFRRGAECCRKASLCTFRGAGRTPSRFPPKRADPYSLEFDSINFTYTETPVMPRKVSFEDRKIICVVRACGPEALGEAGNSDARLRGVPSAKSHPPSPSTGLWWLPKLKAEPCGSLSSRQGERGTRNPSPVFSPGLSGANEVTSLLIKVPQLST